MLPPHTKTRPTRSRRGLSGVVVSWPAGAMDSSGRRRGAKVGRVRLQDGRIVAAQWSGAATMNARQRPTAEGQRVALSRDAQGVYRATLVEPADVMNGSSPPLPKRAPLQPLPETLRRAVAAGLAAGESPWTVAARHGVAVEQVRGPCPSPAQAQSNRPGVPTAAPASGTPTEAHRGCERKAVEGGLSGSGVRFLRGEGRTR